MKKKKRREIAQNFKTNIGVDFREHNKQLFLRKGKTFQYFIFAHSFFFVFCFCILDQEFVVDLKNRIKQLTDLISIQEEVNELFLSRNELVIIENEPSQLNQAKLKYLKNEKSKLEGIIDYYISDFDLIISDRMQKEFMFHVEILLKMETTNELEQTLTEDSSIGATLQSDEIIRTDSDSPEHEPELHAYETQERNSIVTSLICSSIRKAPAHVSDDDEKKTNDNKKQYTRLMTIDELIQTEKNYYSQMNTVHQVFFDEKNSSSNVVFAMISIILAEHAKLNFTYLSWILIKQLCLATWTKSYSCLHSSFHS